MNLSRSHACRDAALLLLTPLLLSAAPVTNVLEAPIMVTAGRVRQEAAEIPAQVTVITAAEMEAAGAQNVVDALRDLGGVYVRTLNGNPAQAEVSLRGFGENAHGRVLVLCDGQRLNSPDMAGINWLQIPLGTVQRVEILQGGQSVLYGDHALGGVINIVTRDAGDTAPGAGVSVLAGSYGTFAARTHVARAADQARVNASADWQTSDGYRDNGGFDALGLRAAVAQDWGAAANSRLSLAFDRYDNGLPGYLSLAQMQEDPRQTLTPDDSASTDNLNAALNLGLLTGAESRLDAGLIYNRKEVESDLASWFSYVDSHIDSLTFTPHHTASLDLLGRPARLLTGLDLYFDRLSADRYAGASRGSTTLEATVEKRSAGAYAQAELDLTDTLTAAVGARLEQARYDATVDTVAAGRLIDQDKTHTEPAVSASLLYRPTDAVRMHARAATVYRFPFVDEQVSYYGYGMDTFYGDLEPEHGMDTDLGGTFRLAPEWQAELSLFLLEMREEIAYNPITGANANLDDTRREGVIAALGWTRAGTGGATVRYTLTDASFTDGTNDGHDVPLVPRHHLSVNGELALPYDCALLATLHLVSDQVLGGDNANAAARLEGYATLDVGLRVTPSRLPGCTVLLALDNVLDEDYSNVAYLGATGTGYYPAPGRTWKTALSCTF